MQAQKQYPMQQTADAEIKVSHYIPSLELKGSRAQKLEKLDALITHLERLRRSIAGEASPTTSDVGQVSPHATAPDWPWFTAGVVVGALLTLWLVLSRVFA